jgi:ferrochelatase
MNQTDDTITAILLLAHGTPNTLGEMGEYLSKVTDGRALPAQVVEELQQRYARIGLGETAGEEPPPLTRWTLAQARMLQSALIAAGHRMRVYAAMRNWHPYITDVVRQMRADGVRRGIALCLAPQNSSTSTGLYRRALNAALEAEAAQNPSAPKLTFTFVEAWSEEPALVEAFAQRLVDLYPRACADACATDGMSVALPVLFTAHSVPCRTLLSSSAVANAIPNAASETRPSEARARPDSLAQTTPDAYPVEAKRTARLVFESASRRLLTLSSWCFAFQSQGVSGGPWIGPTVEETLKALAAEGHRGAILQPIGFLSDHVEILYDIDIAFAETARSLGLRLYRTESLNDSPLLTEALLQVVSRQLTTHSL